MILPIALLYNDLGKLTAVRYFKFDTTLPNNQALADVDYNEIVEYKPPVHNISNAQTIDVPVDAFLKIHKTKLANLHNISRVDANGVPKEEWTQIIVPKTLDKDTITYWTECYQQEYTRLFNAGKSSGKLDEIEYKIRELQDNPQSFGVARIASENGKDLFEAGSICNVYAVDYTGKVFTLPLATITKLVTSRKIKVGNFNMTASGSRQSAFAPDKQYTNINSSFILELAESRYSVYREGLETQSVMQGKSQAIAEAYTFNDLPDNAQIALIPKGVSSIRLYDYSGSKKPNLMSVVCPKVMESVECHINNYNLKNFTAPEEVSGGFGLDAGNVQNLILPKRLLCTSDIGASFRLNLAYCNLNSIAFEKSLASRYLIELKNAPEMQSIILPVDKSGYRHYCRVAVELQNAPKFSNLTIQRASNQPVNSNDYSVAVSVGNSDYTIDLRLPVKNLQITFPETVAKGTVHIKHCGISKIEYFSYSPDNTLDITPYFSDVGINRITQLRQPYRTPLSVPEGMKPSQVNVVRHRKPLVK